MAQLVWGMLFGAIGLGYFIYGRRQSALLPLLCGFGLMVFPYFVTGTLWMLLIGAVLMAVPWYWR
jgi:Zn-dependent protease with chaperone function